MNRQTTQKSSHQMRKHLERRTQETPKLIDLLRRQQESLDPKSIIRNSRKNRDHLSG